MFFDEKSSFLDLLQDTYDFSHKPSARSSIKAHLNICSFLFFLGMSAPEYILIFSTPIYLPITSQIPEQVGRRYNRTYCSSAPIYLLLLYFSVATYDGRKAASHSGAGKAETGPPQAAAPPASDSRYIFRGARDPHLPAE